MQRCLFLNGTPVSMSKSRIEHAVQPADESENSDNLPFGSYAPKQNRTGQTQPVPQRQMAGSKALHIQPVKPLTDAPRLSIAASLATQLKEPKPKTARRIVKVSGSEDENEHDRSKKKGRSELPHEGQSQSCKDSQR